jgi:hypothetical protein
MDQLLMPSDGVARAARALMSAAVGTLDLNTAVCALCLAWLAVGGWLATRRLGAWEYACAALVLSAMLAALLLPQLARASCFDGFEGFVDSAQAITSSVILPKMDALLMAMTSKTSKEQREAAEANPPQDDANVATADITVAYFRRADQLAPVASDDDAKRLQLEYKRIAFLLCRMRHQNEPAFGALMTRLHAPPVVLEAEPGKTVDATQSE